MCLDIINLPSFYTNFDFQSVATTHTAPMSTGTTMVESSFDVQPAATTNLININISNSGNITAVATGENHQINKCYNAINAHAPLRLQSTAQPRNSQYSSLPLTNTNQCVDVQQQKLQQQQQQQQQLLQQQQAHPNQQQQQQLQQRSPIAANMNQIEVFNPDLNTISTIATTSPESNMDALSCNYKNCSVSNSLTKPKVRNDVVFQTPQHNSNRAKRNVVDTGLAMLRNQSNNTPILPPPLFDESTPSMSTATLPLLQPNDSIRQLKSRRHHRTIPRHFTLNDAANNNTNTATNTLNSNAKVKDDLNNKAVLNCTSTGTLNSTLNKKSVCQCPVQHVPMTYMGSAYLNLSRNQPQQTQEMLLSTLTRTKWPSQKSHVAKSASFTSTPSVAPTSTTAHVPGYNRNSASGLLSATNPPKFNGTSTSTETQTSSLVQPKTPSKISTISKQIGHNDLNIPHSHSQVQQQCNDSNDTKSMQELLPININNNEKINTLTKSNGLKFAENTECESMPLSVNAVNPILPPKLSKTPISKSTATANVSASALNSNGLSMSSSLNHTHQRLSARERSKSPAADKTYSMVTPLNFGTDQKVNHIKTTYPTTANLTIASNHFTLPKPLNAAKSPMNIKNQSHALNYNANSLAAAAAGATTNSNSTLSNSKVHSSSTKAKRISMNKDLTAKPIEIQSNESQSSTNQIDAHRMRKIDLTEKSLPVCTTFTNCSNPKEHFLPNDTSLDDDYLSECENCKSAHGSRYTVNYLEEEQLEPQETMTLQRKMDEKECDEQTYYRTSSTLPTNTKQKTA